MLTGSRGSVLSPCVCTNTGSGTCCCEAARRSLRDEIRERTMQSITNLIRVSAAMSGLVLLASTALAQKVPVDPMSKIKQPDLNAVKPLPQLLELSKEQFKKLAESLSSSEKAFLTKVKAPSMTKLQKRQATKAYLEERIRVSSQMLEEFQFVKGKLDATVGVVSKIVGQQGKNSAIADKASKAMSEISGIKKGILEAQREARAWGPAPTDDTWQDWYDKTSAGKKKLRKLFRGLARQGRRQKMYSKLSKSFKMSKEAAVRWRMSIARLSENFEVRQEKIQDEVELSQDFLAVVGAQQAFDDLESLATFGEKMDGLIAGLTSGGIWDEVFGMDLMTVRPPSGDLVASVSADPGFDPLTMDPDEFMKMQEGNAAGGGESESPKR
jgi:hypothetical protein